MIQSKINLIKRETIEPIQVTLIEDTRDSTSKLALVEEANRVEDKEAAERAAEEVVVEETVTTVV